MIKITISLASAEFEFNGLFENRYFCDVTTLTKREATPSQLIIFCLSQGNEPFSELCWGFDSYPCKTLDELLAISRT